MLRNRALNGWKFRRQHPIDRFVVDFACVEARLIVEVDGATRSTAVEIARDAARTEILGSLGFALLRIPNGDIHDHRDGVRETILAAVERRDTV
ncbi:endonuclease domain-containing protein [Methylobacterium oryzae CBMB20]